MAAAKGGNLAKLAQSEMKHRQF